MEQLTISNQQFDSIFMGRQRTKWLLINYFTKNDVQFFPFITLSTRKIRLVSCLLKNEINPFKFYDAIFDLEDSDSAITKYYKEVMLDGRSTAAVKFINTKLPSYQRIIKEVLANSFVKAPVLQKNRYWSTKYSTSKDLLGKKTATFTKSSFDVIEVIRENRSVDSYLNRYQVPVMRMDVVKLSFANKDMLKDVFELHNVDMNFVDIDGLDNTLFISNLNLNR